LEDGRIQHLNEGLGLGFGVNSHPLLHLGISILVVIILFGGKQLIHLLQIGLNRDILRRAIVIGLAVKSRLISEGSLVIVKDFAHLGELFVKCPHILEQNLIGPLKEGTLQQSLLDNEGSDQFGGPQEDVGVVAGGFNRLSQLDVKVIHGSEILFDKLNNELSFEDSSISIRSKQSPIENG
jgi:hypothetical protein